MAPYREPPPERRAVPLERLRSELGARRDVTPVVSVAGLAGAGALVAGPVELAALAGAGALAAAAQLWRSRRSRADDEALLAFLGDAVLEGPGAWTSLDGERRLRVVEGDPWPRWERLDPSTGQTLASHRVPALEAPTPAPVETLERRAARVFGRPRRPRCFASSPLELERIAVEPAELVLVVLRHGTRLERRDREGRLLGDTLHTDADDARRALAFEHPEGVGKWRTSGETLARRRTPPSWDAPLASSLAL